MKIKNSSLHYQFSLSLHSVYVYLEPSCTYNYHSILRYTTLRHMTLKSVSLKD